MGTVRTSTTGTRYVAQRARHPISGRLALRPQEGWAPSTLRLASPHPLKACQVRLFDVAEPARTVAEVASDLDGRFAFTAEQVAGRDPLRLGLDVVAWSHGRGRVCYESSATPWSFRVAAENVGGAPPDVVEALGPGLSIEVPSAAQRAVRVYGAEKETLTAGTEQHSVARAFFAYVVLLELRSLYWAAGWKDGTLPPSPGVTVLYPAEGTWYMSDWRMIFLSGRPQDGATLAELGQRRFEFSPSWLAHEFGHHLFFAGLPADTAKVYGDHLWMRRQPASAESDEDFYRGLHLDFIEGYATFTAQALLRSPLYEPGTGGSGYVTRDMERPACSTGLGDGATAGYLWDLIDRASGEAGDDLTLTFTQVHTELLRFGRAVGPGHLSAPKFHEHLAQSGLPVSREQLEQNLLRNDLQRTHADWKARGGL